MVSARRTSRDILARNIDNLLKLYNYSNSARLSPFGEGLMENGLGIWKIPVALGIAVLSAVATAVFAFFKEDVAVHVASIAVKGALDGEWSIESFAYDDATDPKLTRSSESLTLRQLSFRVIGESRTTDKTWTVSGYYNQPFLALSNVSASGTSGLGSYTGRAAPQGNLAFLGVQIAVNCKGTSTVPVLLKCPALLVRKEEKQLISTYQSQLDPNKCEEITFAESASARACNVSKAGPQNAKPRVP